MRHTSLPERYPRWTKGPSISIGVAVLLLALFWVATLRETGTVSGAGPASLEGRLRRLFEDNAPGIRALAIPMNGLLYVFGERRGADTIFVARSSTRGPVLFFTPEMAFERGPAGRDPVFVRNVERIRERIAALRGSGVAKIILVPVPTKLSVELAADPSLRSQAREIPAVQVAGVATSRAAGPLGEIPDGHRTSDAYEGFVSSLGGSEGVSVVSLQRLFISRSASREDPVFSYEDSHWTSLGLNLAAAEVVRAWRGPEPSLIRAGRLADAPGDLQGLLALPGHPWFRTHPLDENLYELRGKTTGETCPGTAFLLGTSYSSPRAQTLAGQLRQGSGCPVTDLSLHGKGAVASFRPLFGEHLESLREATVIWEFPFRDLLDPASFK